MSNYDLDKVQPRPWAFHPEGALSQMINGGKREANTMVDANSEDLKPSHDNVKHSLHCVNNHDPLVEALEEITGLVLTGIGYTDWKEVRNAEYYELKDKAIEARDGLLAAAKLE